MKAKTIKGNSADDIRMALQQSKADGFKPTLALLFCSMVQDRQALSSIFKMEDIDLFGATTSGEFIDDYQGNKSAVCLLLDLNREYFKVMKEDIGNRDVREVAKKMGENAMQLFTKPAFILTVNGPTETEEAVDGASVIRGIEDAVGSQVTISGGTAGDDMMLTGSYIFSHGFSTQKGLMAVVLDEEKIEISGLAVSGWKPLGTVKTVTKSEAGWIQTIDGKPALDIFLGYMGKALLESNYDHEAFYNIGLSYPLQIQKSVGRPAMCSPIMFNKEEKSLMCEYHLPEGTQFRFSIPPDFDIVEEVLAESQGVKSRQDGEAEALLVFSCVGRLLSLGPLANVEVEGLKKIWNAPMVGFYCYGEFGRALNDRHEFHSTTISWAALKEK